MTEQLDRANAASPVVIIGGGITGLAAAFYLEQAARDAGIPLRCTIVEQDGRFGGKIVTESVETPAGAFLVEGGPDSFVTQKPAALALVRALGLEAELLTTTPTPITTHFLIEGRPVAMPAGMSLIFPTEFGPFLSSPLLSWQGRLRMLREQWVPARTDGADETLADFMRRRFGAEALDRLGEPLLAGIHSSDPEQQSMAMTFPRFLEMERTHGSVIRALIAARRAREAAPAGATPPPPFLTLRGGIGTLVPALLTRLAATLLPNRTVVSLAHDSDAAHPYRLRLNTGETLDADAVIVTTPASAAATLLDTIEPGLAAPLGDIRYVSTATVSLAYPSEAIRAPLEGFGLVIPQSEGRRINALTITSKKFAGRAPDGFTLIRVFAGGARTPETVALDDDAVLAITRDELRSILAIGAAPLWSRVYRWPNGHPQYAIGHSERVAAVEARLPIGLLLAGSSYRGVGLPDCIQQAQIAASAALEQVRLPTLA